MCVQVKTLIKRRGAKERSSKTLYFLLNEILLREINSEDEEKLGVSLAELAIMKPLNPRTQTMRKVKEKQVKQGEELRYRDAIKNSLKKVSPLKNNLSKIQKHQLRN